MQSDEYLFEQIRLGDMQAFDMLYERYERALFSFILRYVGLPQDAEEIFHEAFMRVLEHHQVDFSKGNFRSWLYQIARNLCLNHLRTRKRKQNAEHVLSKESPVIQAVRGGLHSQQEQMEALEQKAALQRAIRLLPAPLAEVYRLRVAGMVYQEIAHVLQIPVGTVKSRMHELVKRLRKELHEWSEI